MAGEPRQTASEEDFGPFSVALKPAACEVSLKIVILRGDPEKRIMCESEGGAAQNLIDDIDCPACHSKPLH